MGVEPPQNDTTVAVLVQAQPWMGTGLMIQRHQSIVGDAVRCDHQQIRWM